MNEINFIPLGGQDELNKEMYAIEFNNDIYILDSGIDLPINDNYGIKYFTPKLDYLVARKNRVKGIFLSSGEYSKVGSLNYLVEKLPNVNIYGSYITLKTLKVYFGNIADSWRLVPLQNRKQIIIDNIIVIPFSISSTTPGTYSYKFKFQQHSLIYLTNYVFDSIFEYRTSVHSIFPNPKEPTTILLVDSFYGADSTNRSYSITSTITESIKKNKNKTVISIYRHDIFNVVELLAIARKYQRKVYFYNETMFNLMKLYIDEKEIKSVNINFINDKTKIAKDCIIIITDDKRSISNTFIDILKHTKVTLMTDITSDDLIILASPPVSGNEHMYADLQSQLSYVNSELIEIRPETFKSVRPTLFDLKNYLQVIKPKFLIPIGGFYKEQIQLQKVFTELDNPAGNFIITFNGQKSTFNDGKYIGTSTFAKQFGSEIIEHGRNTAISPSIITEREQLGNNGVITIGVIVSSEEKKIISNPDIQMRGVIFLKNQNDLMDAITAKFIETTELYLTNDEVFDKNKIAHKNIKEITKLVKAEIKKTPIVIIKIINKDGKK